MAAPSDNQSPLPLPTPAPNAKGSSKSWRTWLVGALLAGVVIIGSTCGLLYFTKVGQHLRHAWRIQFREFELLHLTDHERVLNAGRQVIADPTLYRPVKWLTSNPPKVYHLDPSDPQLPDALRSLNATLITVTDDVLVVRYGLAWGRNTGLVIFPSKYTEAPGNTTWTNWSEGHLPFRELAGLRELREGVRYYAVTLKN